MKFTHREPQAKRQPPVKAVDALVTETPQEDLGFNPQKFMSSPTMLLFKTQLRETAVGEKLDSDSLSYTYWLARFDPEFVKLLKKHSAVLKKDVEDNFIHFNESLDHTEDFYKSTQLTLDQHREFVSALQVLFTPQETADVIKKLNINLQQLLQLADLQEFRGRMEFAQLLIHEFPDQRERILSFLFKSDRDDPEKLLKIIHDLPGIPSTKDLHILLEVFPVLRELLQPEIAQVVKLLKPQYDRGIKTRINTDLMRVKFIIDATRFAVLTAERTWIDEHGLLQFEFAPQRISGSQATLPPRSAL